MTRRCLIIREKIRTKLIKKYWQKRNQLKRYNRNVNISMNKRIEAQFELSKLPRDSSPCRIARRCKLTGRARGVYRKFQISRIIFRNMALNGLLPGVTKSSW